ncbi:MAG: DUF4012 domain-containing protein [Patescibacteria group bacterium]|nr:DUF4012 domain-containing protein [Patescibacteria group bacterium]
MEIPRPPKKKLLERLVPKKHFFKEETPAAILRRERMEAGRSAFPKGIAWGIAGIIVLFVVGFTISFYVAKHEVARSIATQGATLRAGILDLQNFDTQGAQEKFSMLNGNIGGLTAAFQKLGSLLGGGAGAIGSFADLTKQLDALSAQIDPVKADLLAFLSGAPNSLVPDLRNARALLANVDADTDELTAAASFLGSSSPFEGGDYISMKIQLTAAEKFLDAFIPWLSTSTPHHILVLLNNPSELRPGGGFLGSYADVTIASGTIAHIAVHDIADADAAFTKKIIPPKPLQLEINHFRPADANWFFDFPTSASETLWFFNNLNTATSDVRGASPVLDSATYDGVIALTPQVVSDLLSLTGPLVIGKTKFTADNLLVEIQKLVQQGQASSATYPKQILSDLGNALFQKLASSTDIQKQSFLVLAERWIADRDVMAYFTDPNIENFLTIYGATGDVYGLPQSFNGDYLAVVDANINGQKSDLYVSSTVRLVSQIGADGTLTDELSIIREHDGNASPYWWYRAPNQDYLQVFVPPGSALTNESGGAKKNIPAPVNFVRNGYTTDPLVFAIESSTQPLFSYPAVTAHEESGKEVFSTWVRIAAGQAATISMSYAHPLFVAPAPGVSYQFVFEKQAGTRRHYDFEIDAPLGYVFAENGLASYEYKTNDLPGRIIISLTLQKI